MKPYIFPYLIWYACYRNGKIVTYISTFILFNMDISLDIELPFLKLSTFLCREGRLKPMFHQAFSLFCIVN